MLHLSAGVVQCFHLHWTRHLLRRRQGFGSRWSPIRYSSASAGRQAEKKNIISQGSKFRNEIFEILVLSGTTPSLGTILFRLIFFLIFHEFWQYLFKFNWILFKFSELNFVLSATLSATPIQISKKKDWTLSSSAHHHRAVFPSFPCE